jgi:hypothetical protein
VRRNAPLERQHRPQKRELLAAPDPHLDKILGPGQRRAQNDQHDLGQRINHLAGLAWIVERRKMVEQGRPSHRKTSSQRGLHDPDFHAAPESPT